MRVLVVDDEDYVRTLFQDSLEQLGHRPTLVSSAEAALDSLARERPDAIILDIDLPGMSGLDFLQLRPIKESGVPVLAMSGIATESQAKEARRLGAVEYVTKPVTLDRLRQCLRSVEQYALNRQLADAEQAFNRRRAPRALVAVPVRVVEEDGSEWFGTSVDISPFGVKIRSEGSPSGRSMVKLFFTPPDGGPTVSVMALVVRHVDGFAFYFVNLGDTDFQRLSALVRSQRA